jgi:transcriptional regulator with XRE-family HTH domain
MEELKSLREASGLSQFATANRAGLDRTRLSLAENGHVKLSQKEDGAIRRVLVSAIQKRARQLKGVLANTKASVNTAPVEVRAGA